MHSILGTFGNHKNPWQRIHNIGAESQLCPALEWAKTV